MSHSIERFSKDKFVGDPPLDVGIASIKSAEDHISIKVAPSDARSAHVLCKKLSVTA